MKQKIKIIAIFIALIILLFIFQNKVEAKSYSVENMDIQATIENDGSVKIEQEIIYKFNGSYNGIYINVPYNLEDVENENIIKNNRINDNMYNGDSVEVQKVSLMQNGKEVVFDEGNRYTQNGANRVYTQLMDNGIHQIKVYSPSQDTTKTFKIDYQINNLCVKHNDVGELYYNFIGGAWEVTIKQLNIDIYIPSNKTEINIWGHGPYEGESKIINNTHANFQVSNVKPGQYVAARMIFDNSNIAGSQKVSGINAKQLIFSDEGKIAENKEEKDAFTKKVVIFAICLLIYWIILIFVFEKDKKYVVMSVEEDKLFEKYNPMIAGCIQGSRTILARDIIAVILNLIDKKIIKLDFQNKLSGKENYEYIITKNSQLEDQMDEIERYVYTWVFDGKDRVFLQDRLKTMPKEKSASQKFKELNQMVEKRLSDLKANEAKVPMWLRVFNVFLFILGLVVIYKHIMFNGVNIYSSSVSWNVLKYIGLYAIFMLPFIMGILYVPINLIIVIRHRINKSIQKITGQKIVTTTVSLVVLFGVIIALTAFFSPVKYIVADELLVCITTIIMLTDNLMLKNNPTMIEDYSRLNMLRDKIRDYSLMKDRDIEQVVLWQKYLSYAVSFGIAGKIIKRMKDMNLDDDLTGMLYNDSMLDFITSDYYMFYTYASLDRRFLRSYGKATGSVMKAMASGGGRKWRKLFWRRRLLWRRPEVAEAEVPFKNFYFNYFYMYEKNYRRNGGVYDMDKEKVRQLVKEYSKLVVANMIVNKIILYGSYARGNARKDSDIDVAVVVPKSSISKDIIDDMAKLFKLRRNISTDIEPILLIDGEDTSGFLNDILEYGEVVYSN